MSEQELELLSETVDSMFTGIAKHSEASEWGLIDSKAWSMLGDSGLHRVAVPENAGGAGGALNHLAVVLQRIGYHAVDTPLLEDHLAAELLASYGAATPDEILTVASRAELRAELREDRLVVSGCCDWVPWARSAGSVIAEAVSADGPLLVVLPVASADVKARVNIAGEARDTLVFDAVVSSAQIEDPQAGSELRARVLLYRSLMMLGAGERALDMTIQHVKDRTQFGRALAQRQVVQHYVADMAGVLTALRAACDGAVLMLSDGYSQASLPACLATRIEADRMASLVARLSHQLHGAIGFTQEHWLHHVTTRLTAWRQDDASEAACALQLSRIAVTAGGPWAILTGS